MVQAGRHPGMSEILAELLSFKGNESIYKRRVLERLVSKSPSSILLMADPDLPAEEADARTLMLQLLLNDIADEIGTEIPLTIEMNSTRNQKLFLLALLAQGRRRDDRPARGLLRRILHEASAQARGVQPPAGAAQAAQEAARQAPQASHPAVMKHGGEHIRGKRVPNRKPAERAPAFRLMGGHAFQWSPKGAPRIL